VLIWFIAAAIAGLSLSGSVCSRNSSFVLLPSGGRHAGELRVTLSFLGGAILGALALLAVLLVGAGVLSPIPTEAALFLWFATASAVVVTNVATGGCPLPQAHRQIAADAIAARGSGGALQFGAALGSGVMTYMPSCAPYVLVVSVLFARPPLPVAVAGAIGFGVGRSVNMLGRFFSRDRDRFELTLQRVVEPLRLGVAAALAMALVLLQLAIG
jgi:hypothetical protein